MQQLKSMGVGGGGTMMGTLPAGANPQAALAQAVGAAPQNTMTALPAGANPQQGALAMMGLNPQNTMAALPAGAAYQGMPANTMQGFGGFNGMAPLQANAYAGNPQQTALQSMVRGLGGSSPVQPQAYAQNPYAFMGF